MRNAIDIGNGFIVTTDNSGGIGEKPQDIIEVPDEVTAYFAARVALLEQWAAYATPTAILLYNFSGSASWDKYVQGITNLFHDAGLVVPQMSGSTETNIALMQSAMAVTIIGKKKANVPSVDVTWFAYGKPLVGQEVIGRKDEIASLERIRTALEKEIVQRIWPVGSRGILAEYQALKSCSIATVSLAIDGEKSAGPSTVVLLGITPDKIMEAQNHFGIYFTRV